EVKRIITEQRDRVKQLLLDHREHMDEIVKVLLEKETLDAAEFEAIMEEVDRKKGILPASPPADAPPPMTGDNITLDDGSVVLGSQKSDDKDKGEDKGSGGQLYPKFA